MSNTGWTPDSVTVIQMRNNFQFLMDCIENIHDSLCPDRCGTWQMRAEQAVNVAKHISDLRAVIDDDELAESAAMKHADITAGLWAINTYRAAVRERIKVGG